MSTITDKVIETPTIVNIMEKYIELIRKEASYFPECFSNLCIYKNSMDHDITQTSISVRIGGSKDYVVLGLERTDNDTIWQSVFSNGHLAKQCKLTYHEPDMDGVIYYLENNTMSTIFAAILLFNDSRLNKNTVLKNDKFNRILQIFRQQLFDEHNECHTLKPVISLTVDNTSMANDTSRRNAHFIARILQCLANTKNIF